MIRELVPCTDPILKQPLERFDFENPPMDPIELAHDLAETMIANNGLGLSANQMGLPYRAFAMTGEKIVVCFNPMVVDTSTETVMLEEGCLSFPLLFIKVKRPKKIKVRYTEPNGNIVTKVFDGMTARVFQHELDHLDGVVYTSRANSYHIEQARKAKKKLQRKTSKA
jgi:peptide deformylase